MINLKKRFTNKAFLVSFIAAIVLLVQQLGFGGYLPDNLNDVVNTVLTILCMLGIIVDPTTDGVSDSNMVQQGKSSDELLEEIENLKSQIDEK